MGWIKEMRDAAGLPPEDSVPRQTKLKGTTEKIASLKT
jgi:hypothetical protein